MTESMPDLDAIMSQVFPPIAATDVFGPALILLLFHFGDEGRIAYGTNIKDARAFVRQVERLVRRWERYQRAGFETKAVVDKMPEGAPEPQVLSGAFEELCDARHFGQQLREMGVGFALICGPGEPQYAGTAHRSDMLDCLRNDLLPAFKAEHLQGGE